MLLRRFVDNSDTTSVAARLRAARFQLLREIIGNKTSVSVLDIGGRPKYWETMFRGNEDLTGRLSITLVNIERPKESLPGMTCVVGDARSLPQFRDGEFDVVYSNSTIEHVGTFEDQERMAREVRRIGRAYCVQTPNRYFPIEPHFLFPFFQFLPVSVRATLLQRMNLGWRKRTPDRRMALQSVREIRLMTRREVQRVFPEARIHRERYLGMTKSFVAYTRLDS